MCEFISAVKKGRRLYFLTGEQVFDSPRGDALREWCRSADDYTSHGAIRWFYGLEERDGTNVEYTDFLSPKNFPAVIVRAIKGGAMRGRGIATNLLAQTAWAACDRVVQTARAECDRVVQPAWAEYDRVVQTAFWDLFVKPENRAVAWTL